jgi:uncharacterized membrane protein
VTQGLSRLPSLRAAWDDVSTSFWFVPLLMSATGAGLAMLSPVIDARAYPLSYTATRTDALQLLGMILTSMITMASLVFSLTIVALTLAASQFGPRLIRTFMARRLTQVILGTFVMTIVFCLILIARLARMEEDAVTAPASLPLAVGLTLVSVLLLIVHIHTLGRSMLSETVIDLVGGELDAGIDALGTADDVPDEDPETLLPTDFDTGSRRIGVSRQGYVQAIDFAGLVEAAREADVLVAFRFRPGDYLVAEGPDIGLYPAHRATPELEARVARAFTVGAHRTPVQDVAFPIRHLVEIAVRALSPGVNDPYTAAAVIDRLSGSLARLTDAALPAGAFRDAGGRIRVISERETFASLVGAGFDQIRQNGAEMPLILIHLARAAARVGALARSVAQTQVLRREVDRLAEAAERIVQAHDRAAVAERIAAARATLDAAEHAIRHGSRD